jgi:type VI secretion system protein VasG
MIDTHNLILEKNDPIFEIEKYFDYICHVHVSDPKLDIIKDTTFHMEISKKLKDEEIILIISKMNGKGFMINNKEILSPEEQKASEYKKYFERDAALARRFQVIKVEEPDENKAIAMIRGLVPVLEKSHNVRLVDEAVRAAVQLSARYIPSRQLPDKAVSVLDTACARVSVSQTTIPAAIEDRKHRIHVIEAEAAMHDREALVGLDNSERQNELSHEKSILQEEIITLTSRWVREGEIVKDINDLRLKIEGQKEDAEKAQENSELLQRYDVLSKELVELQGEKPLVFPLVDKQSIAEVVQNWTGIPTGRLQSNQISSVLNMRSLMEKRVVGTTCAATGFDILKGM